MRKYKMFVLMGMLLLVTKAFALSGEVANGKYISPLREFSVDLPSVHDMQVIDGGKLCQQCLRHVDFIPNGYYWMRDKAYLIEWFKLNKKEDQKLVMILPRQMKNEFEQRGGVLGNPVCRFVKVGYRTGYQCRAQGVKDRVQAGYIGTSIVMQGWLVNAYVLYPLSGKQDPLPGYQQLLSSIVLK